MIIRGLHVFTDASEKAFGAAIYLRAEGECGLDVSLFIVKARVVQIKFLTIPRLELQGAVVGLRLVKSTCKQFEIPFRKLLSGRIQPQSYNGFILVYVVFKPLLPTGLVKYLIVPQIPSGDMYLVNLIQLIGAIADYLLMS